MVDIEHGALRAFKQDALGAEHRVGEQGRGIADQRPDALGILGVLAADLGVVDRLFKVKGRSQLLFVLGERVIKCVKTLRVEQIGDADSPASGLVFVARPNAA